MADEDFTKDIDAAFFVDQDDPTKDKAYMLKGGQYVRLPFVVGGSTSMEQNYPRPITNWGQLPPPFDYNITAAFFSKKRGKLYLLKHEQYIRRDFVVGGDDIATDPGYPKPLSNWDIHITHPAWYYTAFLSDKKDKLYLLRGGEYFRLSFIVGQGAEMDAGYPKYISDWI